MPLISILIPVRNDFFNINKCLKDIKKQTINNYELILVDDGSRDGTPYLLEKVSREDPRIRVFRTEPRGIISALNTGLEECKGNFIARMDSDDRIHNKRFEKQINFLKKNEGLDLIGCKVEGFSETGDLSESILNYQSWSNSLENHEQMERDLFAESPIVHPTFFGKRQFFFDIGGYADNGWAEDYDIILRGFGRGAKFGKHPCTLLYKYHSRDRLSRKNYIYKRPAMFEAKVHYLLEFGRLKNRRGILIIGSGPTGRQVAESFEKRGVRILGFVDNRKGSNNRTIKKWPAWGFPNLPSSQFLESFRDSLIILAIGDFNGQKAFSELLKNCKFVENRDYVRIIYNWHAKRKFHSP